MQQKSSSKSSGPELQRAIAKTLVYSHLYRFPLTPEEIYRRLYQLNSDQDSVEQGLRDLVHSKLPVNRKNGYYGWDLSTAQAQKRHRDESVFHYYLEEQQPNLRKFLRQRWIRSVCYSGGTAVRFRPKKMMDIDLFVITAPRRAYLVFFWFHLRKKVGYFLSKISSRWSPFTHLDPNYIIDSTALYIGMHQDVFTATQIVILHCVYGQEWYDRFLLENAWVRSVFPNYSLPNNNRVKAVGENSQSLISRRLDNLNHFLFRIYQTYLKTRYGFDHMPFRKLTEHSLKMHESNHHQTILDRFRKVSHKVDSTI